MGVYIMSNLIHGLSIGIKRINNHFFLSLKAVGKLTHKDYETITPMVDSALKGVKEPIVNVFIDGTELEGWELRAAWDDFKLGIKYNKQFKKIAIYSHKKWQERAAKIGDWFMSGEVKFFEDANEAYLWLQN